MYSINHTCFFTEYYILSQFLVIVFKNVLIIIKTLTKSFNLSKKKWNKCISKPILYFCCVLVIMTQEYTFEILKTPLNLM